MVSIPARGVNFIRKWRAARQTNYVSIPARGVNFISEAAFVEYKDKVVSIPARGVNFIRESVR